MITGELYATDFDLGAFLNCENENDRVAGGDSFVLRSDVGKLTAVLAEQFLQNHFSLLDARGVKLTFHGQTDLALLEPIQNVGLRNGVDTVVPNAADDRAFLDVENYIFVIGTVGRILDAELHIFEKLRIPERLKIAAQSFFVVGIAVAAEDAGFQRIGADAAVTCKEDAIDYRSGGLGRRLLERGGQRVP